MRGEIAVIWNPFGRKPKSAMTDEQKFALANSISELLKLQLMVVDNNSIQSPAGGPKRKAIGYVYGYIDAVLRTKGWDMADTDVGVPITYQVIRRLWPGKEAEYMSFLAEKIARLPGHGRHDARRSTVHRF
jgi:hypothetical protein